MFGLDYIFEEIVNIFETHFSRYTQILSNNAIDDAHKFVDRYNIY
jgi:hypothetical protein